MEKNKKNPLKESSIKNNQEKAPPNIQKESVLKPPPAKPKKNN